MIHVGDGVKMFQTPTLIIGFMPNLKHLLKTCAQINDEFLLYTLYMYMYVPSDRWYVDYSLCQTQC